MNNSKNVNNPQSTVMTSVKDGGRCKNSLRNMEKVGIIQPLSVGGKTKIYSMEDVLNVEMNGGLKRVG